MCNHLKWNATRCESLRKKCMQNAPIPMKSSFKSNKSIGAFRCELHHCRSRYANAFVTVKTVFSQFYIAAKFFSDTFMRTINHVAHSTRRYNFTAKSVARNIHIIILFVRAIELNGVQEMIQNVMRREHSICAQPIHINDVFMKIDVVSAHIVSIKMSLITIGISVVSAEIVDFTSIDAGLHSLGSNEWKKGTHRMSVVRTSSADELSTNANSFVWCRQSSNGAVYTRSNYVMKQSKPIQARNFFHCWNHFNIFIIFLLSKFAVAAFSLSIIIFVFVVIPFFCCCSEWVHSRVSCCT